MKQLLLILTFACITQFSFAGGCPTCTSSPPMPGMMTVTGGPTKVCPGDTRSYCVPNDACVTYNWIVPTGVTINSGQGTSCISVTFDAGFVSYTYIKVSASNSCGTSPQRKKAVYLSTTSATPGMMTGNNNLCGLTSTPLSVPAVNNTTYNWTFDNPNITHTGGTSASITANLASWNGVKTYARVTATNGCGQTSAERKTYLTTVPATPTITGNSTVCSFTDEFYHAGVTNATSYTWYGPAGTTITNTSNASSGSSPWVSPDFYVKYTFPDMSVFTTQQTVKVKATNSCGSSPYKTFKIYWGSCKTDGTIEQIVEEVPNEPLSVFPNPAINEVNVAFTMEEDGKYTIDFVNAIGQVVASQNDWGTAGENMISTDVLNFAKGIYFVRVSQNGESKVHRLAVE